MRKKIRPARAVAGLTGRIETIVVLSHDLIGGVQSMQKSTMIDRVESRRLVQHVGQNVALSIIQSSVIRHRPNIVV